MVTEQANKEWTDLLQEEIVTVDAPSSYMGPGEIINKPTADAPLPLRVTDLAFKGYVEVWNTRTGRHALQPRWLLWQTMAKKREDGSTVFTLTDPHIPQNYGADLFCPLNPLSPDYSKLKGMGFQDCRKQHIPHQDGLNRHIRKSHNRAWTALELDRSNRMREEDRQAQRELTEAIKLAVVKGVADQGAQVIEMPIPLADDNSTLRTMSPGQVIPPMEVELIETIQLQSHTHLYRGKKAGAACRVEGCEVVRSANAKTRSKKI